MSFLGFVGFNAIAYCIFLLASNKEWKHPKLQECVCCLFLLLSLPSSFVFDRIHGLYVNSAYNKHRHDIDRLKCICLAQGRPSPWDIKKYGFECDPFTDENGDLDIHAWQEYELSKID